MHGAGATQALRERMVTRAGYAALHIRIAKVLNADFDKATAEDVANSDWVEDITAFTVRQRAQGFRRSFLLAPCVAELILRIEPGRHGDVYLARGS